ncbi:hypothetical protein DPMN_044003 [Dreissena polymorpha]|uniref:Uncharacterized protein n=1 Tax=Dreissena polymorpha TaxID=45954 RepID=A0A9D4HW40_DREPO|nr:hypothetical protein DPMN_044003 [Dreissena polymorpha]
MPSWVPDLVMCACHVETHIYHKPLTCHVYFSLYAQLGTRPGYVCLPCRDSYLSQALDVPCIFQPVCPAGYQTWLCVPAM